MNGSAERSAEALARIHSFEFVARADNRGNVNQSSAIIRKIYQSELPIESTTSSQTPILLNRGRSPAKYPPLNDPVVSFEAH